MYPGIYNQANLIDQATFQAYAPETDISFYEANTFSGIINRATQWISNACEVPTLLQSTITSEEGQAAINPSGDLVYYTMVRPIQKINAVRLVKGGFSTTLNLYGVNASNGQPLQFFQVPYPASKFVYPSSYLAGQGTLMIGGSQQLVSLRGARTDIQVDYVGGLPTNAEGLPTDTNGVVRSDLIQACVLVIQGFLTLRNNQMGASSIRQGDVSISFKDEPIQFELAMEILDKGGYHRVAPRY